MPIVYIDEFPFVRHIVGNTKTKRSGAECNEEERICNLLFEVLGEDGKVSYGCKNIKSLFTKKGTLSVIKKTKYIKISPFKSHRK